jgi:uncharacterized protein (DUF362 family)
MPQSPLNRRQFLRWSATLAAGAPLALRLGVDELLGAEAARTVANSLRADARVAITRCPTYGAAVRPALAKCFDLLGGIGSLVKDKTVTVKLNLTGTDFSEFLGRPVGETFMTHYDTVRALAALLFEAGAKRVRLVESTQSKSLLQGSLAFARWDVKALEALGKVEFENTRNLGSGKRYAHAKVPFGGYMFSAFDLNQAYEDTDVMVSLAKLKNHVTAGVTLSMKNLFGITPNSLYGGQAGNEDATEGRLPLHNPRGYGKFQPPGLKDGLTSIEPTWRVPRITVDVCAARPIHLAIIDGITTMNGGEGPWCRDAAVIKFMTPGVLIAGLNPVSTDAVGTAVMGYADPRALKGTKPFVHCDNHLLMAEQAGLGVAELAKIDVCGETVEKVKCNFG